MYVADQRTVFVFVPLCCALPVNEGRQPREVQCDT